MVEALSILRFLEVQPRRRRVFLQVADDAPLGPSEDDSGWYCLKR
jgi:hypothetical protein